GVRLHSRLKPMLPRLIPKVQTCLPCSYSIFPLVRRNGGKYPRNPEVQISLCSAGLRDRRVSDLLLGRLLFFKHPRRSERTFEPAFIKPLLRGLILLQIRIPKRRGRAF